MSATKPQKISIGFHGGQVLAARVQADALAKLRSALGGDGWHELDTEDGTLIVSVARIDYLLVDSDEHRIGF